MGLWRNGLTFITLWGLLIFVCVCVCCVLGCVTFVVTQSYVKMGKVFLTESTGLS